MVYGKQSGDSVTLSTSGAAGYQIEGASGDRLGSSATELGDTNGDGIYDIALGAADGAVVLYGRRGGARIDVASFDRTTGYSVESSGATAMTSVAATEDLNGDRRPELLVGDPSAAGKGWLGVVYGNLEADVIRLEEFGGHLGFRRDSTRLAEDAGASVGAIDNGLGAGDVDFAVGAPGAADRGLNSGAAYVIPGPDRPDCTATATPPALGYDYVYFCSPLGTRFTAASGATTSQPDAPESAEDPQANTADDGVGFVRNDFKWELGLGTQPYRIIGPDGRDVARGRILIEAIIKLDGRFSLAAMAMEHKSGPRIKQILEMICRRNKRFVGDPRCKREGSEDSTADSYNRGRHRLPVRKNTYVSKRNVSSNKYHYNFRYFLSPRTRPGPFPIGPFDGFRSADWVCKDIGDGDVRCEF